jgi:hypothetical protein
VPLLGNVTGGAKIVKNVARFTDTAGGAVKTIINKVDDVARTVIKNEDGFVRLGGKVHGNSLLTTEKAYGYALREMDTGKILKYGETIHPSTRYSQKYLDRINAHMDILAEGSKREMHYWHHQQILDYNDIYGEFPDMNINGW